jgi:hypothetical protein
MSNTHFFYALRAGKSFCTFNQSPLHFKAFGLSDPVKVLVSEISENEVATHFGWLNRKSKLEHIYQREEDVKLYLNGESDDLQARGLGKLVRLAVVDYKTNEMAA